MQRFIWEFVFLFVLIMLSAFFSLSETAITAIGKFRTKQLLQKKARGAKFLSKLKDNPSKLLGTVLVANNIVNIGASALVTSIVIRYLESIGFGGEAVSVGIATGVMTFLILIFGEISPKTIAIKKAEKLALFAAPYIDVLGTIIRPLTQLFTFLSYPIIKLFGGEIPEKGPFLSREEIKLILSLSEREGAIEEEERAMISSIFEFTTTAARQVMTPRPDMQCLEVNDSIDKAIKLIIEGGHSRIPVYEGNIDNIVGVVYAKELLNVTQKPDGGKLKDYMRPVLFVPETKKIDELLHQMQAARTHLAIIVDEYGVTAGLVTLEDIIEEIVGEIYDEFEKEEKIFEKIADNTWIVDARQSIGSVNKHLGINLPEGEYDTISGFIIGLLGKVPAVGNSVTYDNIIISVERILRRRITRVRIEKKSMGEESAIVGG